MMSRLLSFIRRVLRLEKKKKKEDASIYPMF